MPPHSSLLHIHSALLSNTGNAAKLAQNASLFGVTASTPDPDLKKAQPQILLSAFSSLKDHDLFISWTPNQSPSGAPQINAFLTITRSENNKF